MGDFGARERLITIIKMFKELTDEGNPLSIKEIVAKLQKEFGEDFKPSKKTIVDDIRVINNYQFNVLHSTSKYGANLYYLDNRLFELYQLRLLIDAVASAKFITQEDSKILIDKIKKLTSRNLSKRLHNSIHLNDQTKIKSNKVKYYISSIHDAINENKKISFKYGKYNVKKEFILNRSGEVYIVEPYALVWNNDFYYLLGNYENHKGNSFFRIDRMVDVSICEEKFIKPNINVSEIVNQSFNMYGGFDEKYIKIKFDNHLINVVIDKFGNDVTIIENDETSFTVKVKANVNEGIERWILTWGSYG